MCQINELIENNNKLLMENYRLKTENKNLKDENDNLTNDLENILKTAKYRNIHALKNKVQSQALKLKKLESEGFTELINELNDLQKENRQLKNRLQKQENKLKKINQLSDI